MNYIKSLSIISGLIFLISCNENEMSHSERDNSMIEAHTQKTDKIQVLNFGTFHMGLTNDAHSTEFNERDKENQAKVHEVARKLAAFKPTVIVVETAPGYDNKLQSLYSKYREDSTMSFKNPSEVELLAFEIGRLSEASRIYGIDHSMEYNYNIAGEIDNTIDPATVNDYYNNPFRTTPEINVNEDTLSLLENLMLTNRDKYLDFLLTINADILTHAGTKDSFEGADEAAKYYQRNLRMYSNLNRIALDKEDRVFILMGASHTAFFRDFISRSPKYEMVNTFDYLE